MVLLFCFEQHNMYFLTLRFSVSVALEHLNRKDLDRSPPSLSPFLPQASSFAVASFTCSSFGHQIHLSYETHLILCWCSFVDGIPVVFVCVAEAPDLQEILICLLLPLFHISLSLSLSIEASGQFSAEAGGGRPSRHQLHSASHRPGTRTKTAETQSNT